MPAYADTILSSLRKPSVEETYRVDEDVVVSGMSGRFPESDSLAEFAQNLYDGVDMVTEDDRRWTPGLYGLPTRSGKIPSLDKFDASFFNVSPRQAHCMDPQLRILLEATYEAIMDAGVHPNELKGRRVGVYVGVSSSETEEFLSRNPDNISGYELTGCCRAMFANRISYTLDLKGPSFAVDTACSSSLVALQNAWLAISRGEIESAIVAGSNLTLKPASSLQFHALSMLAKDGKCKAFDSTANGYVRSEAICAVFLQRRADSRRIYAHVVQALTNTDGHKTEGITFPSGEVQRKLLEEVYQRSGVDPAFVSYVEAHGTGTKAGDPQEVNALAEVFCKNRTTPLLLGSVKSNMGHSEPTSGLCSLVKVCLAIQRQEIAGNLHFQAPNPDIAALNDGKIQVVNKNTQWSGKYAAVNCFGFGGANVHVLLKCPESRVQASSPERVFSPVKKKTKTEETVLFEIPRLVLTTARTEESAKTILEELARNKNEDYATLVDNLMQPGAGMQSRGYAVVGAMEDRQILQVTEEPHEVAQTWLIFSGMGSQWSGCGRRLMQLPCFANAIRKCQRALLPYDVDVINIISMTDPDPLIDTTASFVAIAAVQVGLVSVLRSVGVDRFDGFIGHSVGELGCGFADGALNEEQAVLAAYWRGKAVQEARLEQGAMAAVGLSAEEVSKWLVGTEVNVACYNSDTSITISGPKDQVLTIHEKLKKEEIFTRMVNSGGTAFHHPSMAKAAPRLLEELQKVILHPAIRSSKWISSSVLDEFANKDLGQRASPEYFVNNLLTPVCFAQALKNIPPGSTLIEVSPHALMQAVLRRALPESSLVPLVRKDAKDPLAHLLEGLGKMHNLGMEVDISSLYPDKRRPVPGNTPSIASSLKWDHSVEWDVASFKDATRDSEFKLVVDLNAPEYSSIAGHCIDGRVLFPATGYIVLVWRALAKLTSSQWEILPVTLTDVNLLQATVLTKANPVTFTVRILLSKGDFEIMSGESITASGKIHLGATETKETTYLKSVQATYSFSQDNEANTLRDLDVYKELRLRGYMYSGIFKGIRKSNLEGTRGFLSWNSDWVAFLDTMLQFSLIGKSTRNLYLPSRIRKVQIDTAIFNEALAKLNSDDNDPQTMEVTHNAWLGVTSCPGIEIHGLKASLAPRRIISDEPLLESYKFYPRNMEKIEDLTFNDSVRLLVDLFIENSSSLNVKILHLSASSQTGERSDQTKMLVSNILDVMDKYPLINVEYSMHICPDEIAKAPLDEFEVLGINVVDEIDRTAKVHLLIIGEGREQDLVDLNMEDIKDPFVLVDGFRARDVYQKEHRLTVVSCNEKLDLHLMKKPRNEDDHEELIIANDGHFDWVETLKLALNEDSAVPLWLISEGSGNSGLLGMANCLKNEPGGKRIRCLIDPTASIRKDDVQWRKVLTEDLFVNICHDGEMGTYRHLTLPRQTKESCSNAYLNVLTRGDLASLTWLQGCDFQENTGKCSEKLNPSEDVVDQSRVPKELSGKCRGLEISVKNNPSNVCEVLYAPLNFRDIMLASGKLPPDALPGNLASKDCILGLEFAGLNSQGGRVMGLLASGGLATQVECDPLLTWEVPNQWTLEDAATVPVVYATAYYALVIRGKIQKGESVLIHSGSGGVGQAAISIAISRGATVYTTVSSEKKKLFLMERFPELKEENFCASRDSTFAFHIINETRGQGVDLVLNSLAGELLQASVRCLKQHGRFLEIGKADLSQNASLGMAIFLKNITFHGILLDALFDGTPSERLALQNIVYKGMESGEVTPLPATTFNHSQAEEAFRFMASGKHIGKVLLKIKDEVYDPELSIVPSKLKRIAEHQIEAVYKLWPQKNLVYVITGGLGGLGMEICDWLIHRGATKIVLTSRRGISNGYQSLCAKRWESSGANVRILTTDASTDQGAKQLIEQSMEDGHIGGIFHLAMVLHDSLLDNQSQETFTKVSRTKADGAVSLDKVSREICPYLHMWITFSSVAAGRGNLGQSNYAWANSVSERVAENRMKDGFPGLAIQWGGIADVGVLADTLGNIEVGGTKPQSIRSVLESLDTLIGSKNAVTSSLCLVSKKSKNKESGGKSVLDAVANILGIRDLKNAPMTISLGDLGMDSLMAVEIKQTLERESDTVLTPEQIRDLTLQKIKDLADGNTGSQESTQSSGKQSNNSSNIHSWSRYSLVPTSVFSMLSTADSAKPTLLVLSPIQGHCEPLRELASHLDVTVCGLQYTPKAPNGNIVSLASYLLGEITQMELTKPVYLCGYSFGASVAYEMAKQLEQRHKPVDKLILLDGSHSYVSGVVDFHRNKVNSPINRSTGKNAQNSTSQGSLLKQESIQSRLNTQNQTSESSQGNNQMEDSLRNHGENEVLVTFALQLCSCDVDTLRKRLLHCDCMDKKLDCVADTIVDNVDANSSDHKLDKVEVKLAAELFYQRLLAGFEHRPTSDKVSAPTLFIRAKQNSHSQAFGKDYGLQEVLSSPLTIKEVEGTHESFIVGESGRNVAEIINNYIEQSN